MTNDRDICQIFRIVGRVVPWALLGLGAAISALPITNPAWQETAAYMVALALLILSVSYILKRVAHDQHQH